MTVITDFIIKWIVQILCDMKEFNHFEDGSAPFWNIWNLNSQDFVIHRLYLLN